MSSWFTLGEKNDRPVTNPNVTSGLVGLMKGIVKSLFGMSTINSQRVEVGSAVPSALSAEEYAGAIKAIIQVEGARVRVTVDGTPPTASYGRYFDPGDEIELESETEILRFQVIAEVADTTAYLNVDYRG